MKQKTVLAAIFLVISLLAVVLFSADLIPHAFTQCSTCHIMKDPSGSGFASREMIGQVTQICRECHEKDLAEGYSHPVDVQPRLIIVPEDMPLSLFGKQLQCSTCHDVHADMFTAYGTSSYFLRRQETGQAFCDICHGNFGTGRMRHEGTMAEAHFRSKYIVTNMGQDIDPMSANCLTCHDGSLGSSTTVQVGKWRHEKQFIQHDQGSHPIGIYYESVRHSRGRKTDLKPIFEVDRRIHFFDGKVGCGSCHNPYSPIPKRLVMRDDHSRLCLSCHIV
jgi:predicted CXXCH cytochrome family protein